MLDHCTITPPVFWTRKYGPRLTAALSTAQLMLLESPSHYTCSFSSSLWLLKVAPQNCYNEAQNVKYSKSIFRSFLPLYPRHIFHPDPSPELQQVLFLMLYPWSLWNYDLAIPSLHKGKKKIGHLWILPAVSLPPWNPDVYPDNSCCLASP